LVLNKIIRYQSTMAIDARQEFLSRAADALAASPSTSSHLLALHTQLLHENSKALNTTQKKEYCGACGSLRKPQWTRVTDIKPKRIKASSASAPSASVATIYQCLRCRERTVLESKKKTAPKSLRHAAAKASTKGPTLDTKGETQAATDPAKSVDNQNSKKRAKARKQGGLQALLASKKSAQPSLDLFDFLQ
jgi:hypothetical protein